MNIDREVPQGDIEEARNRVAFCLDLIEELEFDEPSKENKFYSKTIGKRLTYEELIGALVSAEQHLKEKRQ